RAERADAAGSGVVGPAVVQRAGGGPGRRAAEPAGPVTGPAAAAGPGAGEVPGAGNGRGAGEAAGAGGAPGAAGRPDHPRARGGPVQEPVTRAELEVVAAQLGRRPRGTRAVAHRCPCGLPAVVET